jgi:hypothetical protein
MLISHDLAAAERKYSVCWCLAELKCSKVKRFTWCSQKIECRLKIKEELEAMQTVIFHRTGGYKTHKNSSPKYLATGILAEFQPDKFLSYARKSFNRLKVFIDFCQGSMIILLDLTCA